MKEFAVIGLGRFGSAIARTLMDLGHDVIAIDADEEVINKIAPNVTFAICANAGDIDALRSIGIANVDIAIVAMSSDFEGSVLATINCKELGIGKVVAKASNETHYKILKRIGADDVVVPERDMGIKLAHNLSSKNVVELFNLSSDYEIMEIIAPKSWYGLALSQLDVRNKYGVNILGINRNTSEFIGNPEASVLIKPNDRLVVLGKSLDLAKIERIDRDE
ncbi:potassium channel family protein [Peptoniphilaceae bacterium SGI.131]